MDHLIGLRFVSASICCSKANSSDAVLGPSSIPRFGVIPSLLQHLWHIRRRGTVEASYGEVQLHVVGLCIKRKFYLVL